jgi:hypothetical protein
MKQSEHPLPKNAVYPCLDVVDHAPTVTESVKHPSHYHAQSGIEVIDAIEAWELSFALGNVVKYVARAGHKDPAKRVEDLRKAQWYLERELASLNTSADPAPSSLNLGPLNGEWS